MSEQLTDWFEPGSVPSRVGIYIIKPFSFQDMETRYSYWNGVTWSYWATKIEKVKAFGEQHHSRFSWRGLASDPNA